MKARTHKLALTLVELAFIVTAIALAVCHA